MSGWVWYWIAGAVLSLLPLFVDLIGALVLAVTKAMLRRRVRRGTQSAEDVARLIEALDQFEAATKRKRPPAVGVDNCPGCSPSLRPACRATAEGCVYERKEAP